jgi:hypothetical protein
MVKTFLVGICEQLSTRRMDTFLGHPELTGSQKEGMVSWKILGLMRYSIWR